MSIGARYLGEGRCSFSVWAPFAKEAALRLAAPKELTCTLEPDEDGFFSGTLENVYPGALYYYVLDREVQRPDPASNHQPQGVHGPSLVVDHSSFGWEDHNWPGIPLEEMVIYELHTGAFTQEGTFDAAIERLDDLLHLGVNTLNIMPVAQFPGSRNWGYDGAQPFAVQGSYGGPDGLKRLVDACHGRGIAVILDVVYNHLGPEGNYLRDFGPYFTGRYRTPWGDAVNFDGPHSHRVRDYFIENALYWFREFHMDGLRLDAVHAIFDMGAKHFLGELAERVEGFSRERGRQFLLIAESDLNDVRVTLPRREGGFGLHAQWLDDFHHTLHTLLAKEKTGYYRDFGKIEDLVKALKEGFVYDWRYSKYRKRMHGSSSKNMPADRFVAFCQNHDQVGNRAFSERLSCLVSFEGLKLAAGAYLLSPYIPLVFMGEEYAEEAPFNYFVSHSDPGLIEAVRKGRKEEFASFEWAGEPPDPQAEETFLTSKLNWEKRDRGKGKALLSFYRELIRLKKEHPALRVRKRESMEVSGFEEEKVVFIRRWSQERQLLCVMNFGEKDASLAGLLPEGSWEKLLDSADERWLGPGPSFSGEIRMNQEASMRPLSFAVFEARGK